MGGHGGVSTNRLGAWSGHCHVEKSAQVVKGMRCECSRAQDGCTRVHVWPERCGMNTRLREGALIVGRSTV